MTFKQLAIGDIFYLEGIKYIKTELDLKGVINSTCLTGGNSGYHYWFNDDQMFSKIYFRGE